MRRASEQCAARALVQAQEVLRERRLDDQTTLARHGERAQPAPDDARVEVFGERLAVEEGADELGAAVRCYFCVGHFLSQLMRAEPSRAQRSPN